MALPIEDAMLLREDDIVLIPFRVERTNGFWEHAGYCQVYVHSQFSRNGQTREERDKPPPIYNLASRLIDSVMRFDIRVDDYVRDDSFPAIKGTVLFIDKDTNDVMIRVEKTGKDADLRTREGTPETRTITRHLSKVTRIPTHAQLERWKEEKR